MGVQSAAVWRFVRYPIAWQLIAVATVSVMLALALTDCRLLELGDLAARPHRLSAETATPVTAPGGQVVEGHCGYADLGDHAHCPFDGARAMGVLPRGGEDRASMPSVPRISTELAVVPTGQTRAPPATTAPFIVVGAQTLIRFGISRR